MKRGDIIKHCKRGYEGVIITMFEDYVEVLWTYPGMYNPETIHINELKVVRESESR